MLLEYAEIPFLLGSFLYAKTPKVVSSHLGCFTITEIREIRVNPRQFAISDNRRNMPNFNIKPTHKRIKQYYAELQEYDNIGAAHEGAVRTAFQTISAIPKKGVQL